MTVRRLARSRGGARPAAVAVVALALALACGPITAPPASEAPMNACSTNQDCAAYAQTGATPTCNFGQCGVVSEFTNLAIVISLPQDSPFAPERTFAFALDEFLGAPRPQDVPPEICSNASGHSPQRHCAWLPGIADITGSYSVQPSYAQEVGWNLGSASSVWLPVQATYRLLWPAAPGSNALVEASSLGLPVDGVTSILATETAPGTVLPPGPNGGPSPVFHEVNLPPGTYELTLMPAPPLDTAFPAHVETRSVSSGTQTTSIGLTLDHTRGTDPSFATTDPTFDITLPARDAGLNGWVAFLRDATTLRRISNLVALSGITNTGVQLNTDHNQADALTNAQLVVEPPAGQPIPTYVLSPIAGVIYRSEPYPALPSTITIHGSVTAADGSPLEAELEFDDIEIDRFDPVSGALIQDSTNLEYAGSTSARIGASGTSSYAVTLPQGQYRLTIRPFDTTAAVTIVQHFVVVPPNPLPGDPAPSNPNVAALPLQIVQGAAYVADGRPLAGATVDAVPMKCFDSSASPSCMPRAAQTPTASDGSFTFGPGGAGAPGLDPGSYILRVRPADGTRLPWVWQAIVVGPTPVTLSPMLVPAPAYAPLTLYDASLNTPVINAVVRMFAMQPQGPAVEVARAITDTNGDYDMYLAPAAPASP